MTLKPAEFEYEQDTGRLYDLRGPKPVYMGTGYSGYSNCINDPACESIAGIGPTPVGRYRIRPGRSHPRLGPVALFLEPLATTDTFGRSEFFIHGDNRKANRTASRGCPIFGRVIRDIINRCAGNPEGAYLTVRRRSDRPPF